MTEKTSLNITPVASSDLVCHYYPLNVLLLTVKNTYSTTITVIYLIPGVVMITGAS